LVRNESKKEENMAKITAWLVTLVGVLLVLDAANLVDLTTMWATWVIALAVLVIGVAKIMRNYKAKRK